MIRRFLIIAGGSLSCLALLVNAGCCSKCTRVANAPCGSPCVKEVKAPCAEPCPKPAGELTAELPPNAKPGECWAKVFVPPTFKTVTERVLVKEASETLEIIPAKYDWVEERVCIKEASTILKEVPAEYRADHITVKTDSAHTDWQITKATDCDVPGKPGKESGLDVYCLVNFPENHRTLDVQRVARPARVEEQQVPAEYQTVRKQRLVQPATTKKTCIPAEYTTVEKTVKVCDGRMAWQRVDCSKPHDAVTMNNDTGATKVEFVAGGR